MPRPLRRDLAILGLGVVVALVAVTAWATFRIWQQGQVDERDRPVDAIVVLGAAQVDGTPSPVFRARIDHALDLYRAGVSRVLVMTGGRQSGDQLTEAATARDYAMLRGVPAPAILTETTGRDTLESLRHVAAILRAHGLSRALFVSDRSHMLRVLLMASDLGLEARGSPTTTSPLEKDLGATVDAYAHELGGLAFYLVAP